MPETFATKFVVTNVNKYIYATVVAAYMFIIFFAHCEYANCDEELPYSVEYVSDRFRPTGWMGDYGALSLNPSCDDDPHSGDTCIEIHYTGKKTQGAGWTGIYWLYPEYNWGGEPGWKDVFTGATNLTFWARGKEGGEKVKFEMGGIAGEYSDSIRLAKSTRIISLSDEWKQYSIDLTGKDLSHVIGGFCWVTNQQQNHEGCIIYLDDIRYEWC